MKTNESTKLLGRNVILVPYQAKHVPKYHGWMKSPELQLLTASEPLTLQEEFDMQKSWHNDEDKCTFIILDKDVLQCTGDEMAAMIGDTNLFLQGSENLAEAEIMIAEESAQGKRRGWEAMMLMLRYGCEELQVGIFQVKIGMSNTKSIALFSKLNFQEVSRSMVFQEITLERKVSKTWKLWLDQETKEYLKTQIHADNIDVSL